MQRTNFLQAIGIFVFVSASPAQSQEVTCSPPIATLQAAVAKAEGQLTSVAESSERSRANVVTVYRTLDTAITNVAKARAENVEVQLNRAVSALATTKKAYDEAVAAERPQLIARIEAERTLRGARQALNETVVRLQDQGKALISAVERAKRAEVVPSAMDLLACEQGDCVKITTVEHATMMSIGALADTLDPSAWPPKDRACDFTLFERTASQQAMTRVLRTAQKDTQSKLQTTEANLIAARQDLATRIPAWNTAITDVLDTYGSPAGNSHADELLGLAIEELRKQDAAFDKLTAPYRSADEAAIAARQTAAEADRRLSRQFEYWADLGRAVIDAAARAQRGGSPRSAGACQLGSSSPAGPWVFAIIPPPNC